jgi:hypothetical protein
MKKLSSVGMFHILLLEMHMRTIWGVDGPNEKNEMLQFPKRGGDDLRLCPDGLGIERLRLRRLGATLSDRPTRLLKLVSLKQRQEEVPLIVEGWNS